MTHEALCDDSAQLQHPEQEVREFETILKLHRENKHALTRWVNERNNISVLKMHEV